MRGSEVAFSILVHQLGIANIDHEAADKRRSDSVKVLVRQLGYGWRIWRTHSPESLVGHGAVPSA